MANYYSIQLGIPAGDADEEGWEPSRGILSKADVVKVMSDRRYRRDPAYRKLVHEMIKEAPPSLAAELGIDVKLDLDGCASQQAEAAQRELIRKAFSDPRYKTSAVYREEILEKCRDPRTDKLMWKHPEQAFVNTETKLTGPTKEEPTEDSENDTNENK